MNRLTALLAVFLAPLLLHAADWRNDGMGVSASLPDTQGWTPIPAPSVPGITVLAAMHNSIRQAVFGVNTIDNPPGLDLRDAKLRERLEAMLRGLGYQFVGHSVVPIAGVPWTQYPVTSNAGGQVTKGVVRFASANGRIFSVSLLVGGGMEASQDLELQAAAASVRFYPPRTAVASTQAPPAPAADANAPKTPAAPAAPASPGTSEPAVEPGGIPPEYLRWGLIGLGGLVVLLVLMKIIGGGGNKPA